MKPLITIFIILIGVGCGKPEDSVVGSYQHDGTIKPKDGKSGTIKPLFEITLRPDKVYESRFRDHPSSKPKVFKTEKEKKDRENTKFDPNKPFSFIEETTAAERKPKVGRWEMVNSEIIVTFQQSIRDGSAASGGYYNYYAMAYYRVEENGDLTWVAQGRKMVKDNREERKDLATEDFKTFKKVK